MAVANEILMIKEEEGIEKGQNTIGTFLLADDIKARVVIS